jgi:hypothetical protein
MLFACADFQVEWWPQDIKEAKLETFQNVNSKKGKKIKINQETALEGSQYAPPQVRIVTAITTITRSKDSYSDHYDQELETTPFRVLAG